MAGIYFELNCGEVAAALAQGPRPNPEHQPPCTFSVRGKTMEELMEQCARHATEEHGWRSFPPEMWAEMRKLVKTVPG